MSTQLTFDSIGSGFKCDQAKLSDSFPCRFETNRAFKGFTTELCYIALNYVSNGEMSSLLNIFPIIDLSMNMISCLNVKVDEIVALKDHITDSFISITD